MMHRAEAVLNSFRTVPADRRDHLDGRRSEWDCKHCQRTVIEVYRNGGVSTYFKHKADR
jgi:hypothetical protein